MDNTGSPTPPLDEPTLRAWARAGEKLRAEARPHGRHWHLWIERQGQRHRLTTPSGAPHMFRTLETLARRLMALNIVDLEVIRPNTGPHTRPPAAPPPTAFNDGLPEDEAWDAAYRERLLKAMRNDRPGKDFRQVHAEMRQMIRGTGGPHARPKKC